MLTKWYRPYRKRSADLPLRGRHVEPEFENLRLLEEYVRAVEALNAGLRVDHFVLTALKRELEDKLKLAQVIETLADARGGQVKLKGRSPGALVTVAVHHVTRYRGKGGRIKAPADRPRFVDMRTPANNPDDCAEDVATAAAGADDADDDEGLDAETLALERKLLARGLIEQREMLERPEMLTLEQAQKHSGIPVRTLTDMRRKGRILALARSGAQKGYRFPDWQFDDPVMEAIPDILRAFGPERAWEAYDFLTHREPLLGDKVPLEELRRGHRDAVLRILRAAASLDQGAY